MPDNESKPPRTVVFHTRKSAADRLTKKQGAPISESTLTKWAVSGRGPPFRRVGRNAIYEETDLNEYALSRLTPKINSTSELVHRPGSVKPKGRLPKKIAAAKIEPERQEVRRKREPVA